MPFCSVLFTNSADADRAARATQPDFFSDLNLDQVVESAIAGRNNYRLEPFFHTPLSDVDSIVYRHEVLADLDNKSLSEQIRVFAHAMRDMRDHLARIEKLHYERQKQGWFVDAVELYCTAVRTLADELAGSDLRSRGFRSLRQFLTEYVNSTAFTELVRDTDDVKSALADIHYSMQIRGLRIRVSKYGGEDDYSANVDATFEKFQQGRVDDYAFKQRNDVDMDHVEAGVLDRVAQLYPDTFATLARFCDTHVDYLNTTVNDFDREIQFYLAYVEYIEPLQKAGLEFSCPVVSDRTKQISVADTFDLALATKLVCAGEPVICNDITLTDDERIIVVSGPNQGGKTTFSRTFGQLHYLARLGLPVPGRNAHLFLGDQLFTHYEKEENLDDLSGKLQDDLIRIRDILDRATGNSIIILNEIFNSTTVKDALLLATEVLHRVIRLDALCVCVTFIDELAGLSPTVVSMVSTVVPDNPAVRTFKVIRRPADGRSYAVVIAEKYGLTYEQLRKRVGR